MRFFVELFRSFLNNTATVRKPSKMSFIGIFLYLAGIVGKGKEYYYNGYKPTDITKKNQSLIKRHGTITINDKEYLKEPVDVGKDIADTIKNCKICEPTNISLYISATI